MWYMSATDGIHINEASNDISFGVEIRVPQAQAKAFAALLTGNDDDVILAAETAIRETLGRDWQNEEVEIVTGPDRNQLREQLVEFGAWGR
jgi:hypothetical protein